MSEPLSARESGNREGGPSFSLGNRLFRIVWGIVWLVLARWTPPPLHAWRANVLRAFGAKLGANCRIYGSVKVWHPGNLVCGRNVTVGPGALLYNQGRIVIADDVTVSQRAHLCASSHLVNDYHFQLVLRPVTIEKLCWVAAESFVGPGVTMAEGSVLAARGALFASTEPYGIYRGNPAEWVKQRVLSGVPQE